MIIISKASPLRILSIDPGPKQTGSAFLTFKTSTPRVLKTWHITVDIVKQIKGQLLLFEPTHMVVENFEVQAFRGRVIKDHGVTDLIVQLLDLAQDHSVRFVLQSSKVKKAYSRDEAMLFLPVGAKVTPHELDAIIHALVFEAEYRRKRQEEVSA